MLESLNMSKIPDTYKMPFGTHKDEPIGGVPASYLIWLSEQKWIGKWDKVEAYINQNYELLTKEDEENES